MKLPSSFQGDRGFTLTELMVVVSLIAIMTGVGYSGFSSWQKKERLNSVTYRFADYLKEVRMLAIEKRTCHTITFDANQYTIFVDLDADGELDTADGEVILRQVNVAQWDPDITITTNPPNNYVVIYNIRGMPVSQTGGFGDGKVTFSREDGTSCEVNISSLGSIRVDASKND